VNILTRDLILQANDLRRELVEVPEWGGVVYVRSLTGAERDRFEASILRMNGVEPQMRFENFRARMVAMTIVDSDGKQLFSEADIEALATKNAAALERVFKTAQKLSGFTKEDVEELAKN